MTKTKKKTSKKTSPVFLSDDQSAQDAPDNLLGPPVMGDPRDMLYSSVTCRRSEWLCPVLSKTLGDGDMSNRVSPRFNMKEPEVGRISDQNEGSVRNNDSQCRSLILTPVLGVEESRSSLIHTSRQLPESRSPTNDGNQSGSEQRSMKVQMLEL